MMGAGDDDQYVLLNSEKQYEKKKTTIKGNYNRVYQKE